MISSESECQIVNVIEIICIHAEVLKIRLIALVAKKDGKNAFVQS